MGARAFEGHPATEPPICHPERSPEGAESKDPDGVPCVHAVGSFLARVPGSGFVVEMVLKVGAGPAASGSFDYGSHGEAVRTSAQDDRVWKGL